MSIPVNSYAWGMVLKNHFAFSLSSTEVGGGRGQPSPGNLCPRTVYPGDCSLNISPRDVCPHGFCHGLCPRSPIFDFSVPVLGPRFSKFVSPSLFPVPVFQKILFPSLSPSEILHNFCPRPCPQPVSDKFWPVANLTSLLL